jgi:hypothetical protein
LSFLAKTDLASSLAACTVRDTANQQAGKAIFLPPMATVGATPFKSMTESHEASYSNFRFFSEV